MSTPVIFRRFKPNRAQGEKGGDLIAIFPTLVGTSDAHTCMSYQHIGQHGACDPAGLMRVTTPVDPRDFGRISLWVELCRIGYTDMVYKRRLHPSYLELRRRKIIAGDVD